MHLASTLEKTVGRRKGRPGKPSTTKCLPGSRSRRLTFELFEERNLLSVVSLISPGGDESVDGGLRLILDPYGAFGSNAGPAENAWFNPSGSLESAGTTYESAVFLRSADGAGFLAEGDIDGSGNLPSVAFDSTTASSAVSSFARGNLSISLTQSIQDRFDSSGAKVGSALIQDYQITNTSTSAVDFSMVRYLDGDLYYAGAYENDWGGASTTDRSMNQQLFEFDTGDNPNNPTTLITIRAIGGVVRTITSKSTVSPDCAAGSSPARRWTTRLKVTAAIAIS